MNKLLAHCTVAVTEPGVIGFEMFDMLYSRDKLAEMKSGLSAKEQEQLQAADALLIQQAPQFLAERSRFTDLRQERQRRQPPPAYWWWYLDVLAALPIMRTAEQQELMPA